MLSPNVTWICCWLTWCLRFVNSLKQWGHLSFFSSFISFQREKKLELFLLGKALPSLTSTTGKCCHCLFWKVWKFLFKNYLIVKEHPKLCGQPTLFSSFMSFEFKLYFLRSYWINNRNLSAPSFYSNDTQMLLLRTIIFCNRMH